MRSRARAARRERRQFRQLTKDLDIGGGFGESRKPRHHMAKDALGAVVTLAIAGVILLQVTDGLASRCGAGPNSRAGTGACSGAAAFAHHAQLAVTLGVAALGALAVLAFIWYMLWGYKTNGQTSRPGTP
jgi:ABC-type Fe3+-siderophore transport system permease subunit